MLLIHKHIKLNMINSCSLANIRNNGNAKTEKYVEIILMKLLACAKIWVLNKYKYMKHV